MCSRVVVCGKDEPTPAIPWWSNSTAGSCWAVVDGCTGVMLAVGCT